MRIFHRFATRILLAALLVSAVPLLILGVYGYRRISGSLEQSALEVAVGRASRAVRSVRFVLSRVERDVLFLSRLTSLRNFLEVAGDDSGPPDVAALGPPRAARTSPTREEAGQPGVTESRERARRALHLERDLVSFIKARPLYDQVRYVDADGREFCRVDADGRVTWWDADGHPEDGESFANTVRMGAGQVYVSATVFDAGPPGRSLLVYGTPVGDGSEGTRGVILLTVRGDEVLRQAREALAGEYVDSFVADEQGRFLHHSSLDESRSGRSLQQEFPGLTGCALGEKPAAHKLGDDRVVVAAQLPLVSGDPTRTWTVGQVHSERTIFHPVAAFRRTFLLLLGLTVAAAGVLAAALAHHLAGPIRELQAGFRQIGAGELGYHVPVQSRDEFGELARSFSNMSDRLKEYVTNVEEATAARARTETELRTARDIQQTLLPHKFPPFPQIPSFDVFARNIPAYEVGGDFYDFSLVSDDVVLLALGDVSGKGVPAALLMVMTSTLLRTFAAEGSSPSEILVRSNRALLERGDSRTFVTVFLAFYQVSARRLTFANAGHTVPLVLTSQGAVNALEGGDLPLGVDEQFRPQDVTVQLARGDRLVLYSDGLTEARDDAGSPFGSEGLTELLQESTPLTARDLCNRAIEAVMTHQGGAPQFDDLTVLVLELR